jgi:hypothetical protein
MMDAGRDSSDRMGGGFGLFALSRRGGRAGKGLIGLSDE